MHSPIPYYWATTLPFHSRNPDLKSFFSCNMAKDVFSPDFSTSLAFSAQPCLCAIYLLPSSLREGTSNQKLRILPGEGRGYSARDTTERRICYLLILFDLQPGATYKGSLFFVLLLFPLEEGGREGPEWFCSARGGAVRVAVFISLPGDGWGRTGVAGWMYKVHESDEIGAIKRLSYL